MHWIIDLLVDKLKKDKTKEWEPQPLWIEDDYCEKHEEKKEEDEKKIVIIDL